MLKIIAERRAVEVVEYYFEFTDEHGNGYSFPCDAYGELSEKLSKEAEENYIWCQNHRDQFDTVGIRKHKYYYTEPAIGRCSCGYRLQLINEYQGACECVCGQWYNLFGQELIPPEYWED